jgi:hypothetical protein
MRSRASALREAATVSSTSRQMRSAASLDEFALRCLVHATGDENSGAAQFHWARFLSTAGKCGLGAALLADRRGTASPRDAVVIRVSVGLLPLTVNLIGTSPSFSNIMLSLFRCHFLPF